MAGSVRRETYNRMVARVATLQAGLDLADAVCRAWGAMAKAMHSKEDWGDEAADMDRAYMLYLAGKEKDDGRVPEGGE